MTYHYDLADFKRYLNDKNPKYRVDGLIFWQNRIPLPIDLFNQFFDEADEIVAEYVSQVVASALVFSCADEFFDEFDIPVDELPNKDLLKQKIAVAEWVENKLKVMPNIRSLASEIVEILDLNDFELSSSEIAKSLSHQGKKYFRLFMPPSIRDVFEKMIRSQDIGKDNTDMFGNIIADRYNIYRSGFSDALAIIFNVLLEFRILCSEKGTYLKRLSLSVEKSDGIDVRLGKTSDGSLWEPGYDDDHYVTLSEAHPLLRNQSETAVQLLAELVYCLSEVENKQYSDTQRKQLENMRQEVSRSLWIRND